MSCGTGRRESQRWSLEGGRNTETRGKVSGVCRGGGGPSPQARRGKICWLNPIHLQKCVLELDIPVHDAPPVAVVDSQYELLEEPPESGSSGRW